ncbi:MAG: hypothetical protein AMJ54_04695 [Deltaproteobacteria bacterium SG8_13]|nr:MAG: hypothetical protein AMJ54_04695 [Deltaproteobacteria bacterium SG8_13]
MKHITRRDFIRTASAAFGTACLTGFAGMATGVRSAMALSPEEVRIGVVAPSHCALPMVHAFHTGLLEKAGIRAQIRYMDMHYVAKGLLDGEIDVGQLISPVFFAVNSGVGPFTGNAKALVTAQIAGTNGGVLVVGNQTGIDEPKHLAGKTIGVHSPFMVHSLLVNRMFQQHGIDPSSDITIKLVHMKYLIPALMRKEIDAFINPEPLGTFAIKKQAGRELMITKDLWPSHPCCIVAMRKDYFEENPDRAHALYGATVKSSIMLNDPAGREEALARVHRDARPYSQVPLAAIKKAFRPGRTDFDPFVYQSSGKAVLSMMQGYGLIHRTADIDTLVSDTFMSGMSRQLMVSAGAEAPEGDERMEEIVGRAVS